MKTRLIVALDYPELEDALSLAESLDSVKWFKVGKQLFTRYGPRAVKALKERGRNVFLDLKFHDIPNTVAHAVRSSAAVGADMTNVHASGGPAMLAAAAAAGRESNVLVIAVTVLTSLDRRELAAVGIDVPPQQHVVRLANLAKEYGIAGVVCSAHEIHAIRQACGSDFQLIVPGIRPAGAAKGDQKRIMTPAEAAAAGAQFIVVGRPITQAPDPEAAAAGILADIETA